jgi:hypothetical protein
METNSRREIADILKEATISYFLKKGFSCFVELGLNSWGKLRGDVVAVNLKSQLVVCECKSSKSDFLLDSKWEKYLEYSNKFYFVFPHKVFEAHKALILLKVKGKDVGILILDPTTGYLKAVRAAKQRGMKKETKASLILRMAWRNGISKRNSRRKRQYLN